MINGVKTSNENRQPIQEMQLRDVEQGDLAVFFDNQLDPEANFMAALTSKDSTDRAAFDAHWEKNSRREDSHTDDPFR